MGPFLKLIGSVLVTASLILGATAAATAYLAPISSIDPTAEPVTLHAPAGRDDAIPPKPILVPGPRDRPLVLGADELATLEAAGVRRVHVKEFSFARWREKWLFALAVVGLVGGAGLLRAAQQAAMQSAATDRSGGARPDELLDAALGHANRLRDELDGRPATGIALTKLAKCVERMQSECFDPFVESRPVIVDALGMAGYAQLMDRFAAAERQFNRAWSAAADNVPTEATECFGNGIALLEETRGRLTGGTA